MLYHFIDPMQPNSPGPAQALHTGRPHLAGIGTDAGLQCHQSRETDASKYMGIHAHACIYTGSFPVPEGWVPTFL